MAVVEGRSSVEGRREEKQCVDEATQGKNIDLFVDRKLRVQVDLLGRLVEARGLSVDLILDLPTGLTKENKKDVIRKDENSKII